MRLTISAKLFAGFLVVIFLNVFYVVVVSKLADLNIIVTTLKHMNDIKNALLRLEDFRVDQSKHFLVYEKLRRPESIQNFADRGRENAKLTDSILSHLDDVRRLDTMVSQDEAQHMDRREQLGRIIEHAHALKSLGDQHARSFAQFVAVSQQPPGAQRAAREAELKSAILAAADSLDSTMQSVKKELDEQSSMRIQEIGGRIENAKRLTLMILISVSAFALMVGFLFSRAITNSLRRLRESSASLAKGSFDFNPRGYPNDEIGELAHAFFDMAQGLKSAQDELVKSKRMAAIGEVVASVNHEINNPLMIISGNAQFLEMSMENAPPELKERVHAIIEETDRISHVTKKLREIKNPVVEDYTSRGEQMINLEKSSR